ncbi:hypothetical protein E4T80_04145 [Muribacter muris]|uniref:Uncharacterized protein n=1 Tax=Muribacter muris TaxID=67855 RepID=A0A4Y9K330_9PAST|nr:hypothetical protein [Muribacter muris]MBF0784669.1 hypothetical protein [Muribacter muris]MBF0828129.1 hypothetical protein [Muribacter muris]TFV11942.1 hypothetical protein E4T80_04145 [Muribacter muris]
MKSEKYIAILSVVFAVFIPVLHSFYLSRELDVFSVLVLSVPVFFACILYAGISQNAVTGAGLTVLVIYFGFHLFIANLDKDEQIGLWLIFYPINSIGAFITSGIGYLLLKQECIKKPFWIIALSSGLTLIGFGLPFLLMVL